MCLFSLSSLSLLRNPRCCLPLLLNADTQNCLRARADARANYTEGETLALRQHFKRSSERIVVVVVVVQQSARVELLVSRARGVCTNGQKIRSLRPSLSLSLSGTAAPLWLLLLPDDEVHCCYCYTVLYAKIENGAPHVCVCLSCPYPLSRCPLPRRRSLFCRSTLGFLSRRSRPTHEPLSLSLSRHPVHLFLSAARICIYISLSLSLSLISLYRAQSARAPLRVFFCLSSALCVCVHTYIYVSLSLSGSATRALRVPPRAAPVDVCRRAARARAAAYNTPISVLVGAADAAVPGKDRWM